MQTIKYIAGVIALIAAIWQCSSWNIPKADITEDLHPDGWVVIAETEEPTEPVTEPEPEPQPAPIASTVCRSLSPDEQELLVRVAWLEAGNQGWEGMAAVMNVILNRCNLYNATVDAIIYSPNQFTGILELIPTATPTEAAYTALGAVLQGWDVSQGALYFCSPAHNGWHSSHLTYLFTGWGHEFYK